MIEISSEKNKKQKKRLISVLKSKTFDLPGRDCALFVCV